MNIILVAVKDPVTLCVVYMSWWWYPWMHGYSSTWMTLLMYYAGIWYLPIARIPPFFSCTSLLETNSYIVWLRSSRNPLVSSCDTSRSSVATYRFKFLAALNRASSCLDFNPLKFCILDQVRQLLIISASFKRLMIHLRKRLLTRAFLEANCRGVLWNKSNFSCFCWIHCMIGLCLTPNMLVYLKHLCA